MKKYFKFAVVAAAGMLASCSSESLTGSDPKIEPTQEELVPIEISVASPSARAITRGTGTVGGVVNGTVAANNDGTTTGSPKANIWAGQRVKVYMFNKGTLTVAQSGGVDLFNNAEMVTPAATDGTASGLAHYVDPNSTRYLVKYYPLTGAYDFWGYRIDDATAAADPAVSDGKLSLGITVNGTQDVLGAKTKTPDLTGTNPVLTEDDLYSAKAARQSKQPELDFKHLMTRLTFEAYPGNNDAKTVYVTGIKVRALNAYDPVNPAATVYQTPTGTLDIAGTDPAFEQKITWGTDATAPAPFELMKRVKAKDVYSVIAAASWYSLNSAATDVNKFISATAYDALPATGTEGDGNDKDEYTPIAADSWYALTAAPKINNSFISATDYAALPATSDNQPLVVLIDPLAPTAWATNGAISMDFATDGSVKAPIGDAIIAPDAQAYEIEIELVQKVAKYEDSNPATPGDWEDYQYNSIKTVVKLDNGATRFLPGYTYDFIFKVYGLERIQVTTTLEPWIWGENQTIITE